MSDFFKPQTVKKSTKLFIPRAVKSSNVVSDVAVLRFLCFDFKFQQHAELCSTYNMASRSLKRLIMIGIQTYFEINVAKNKEIKNDFEVQFYVDIFLGLEQLQ